MARPSRLDSGAVDVWLANNDGWARAAPEGAGEAKAKGEALVRTFSWPDFGAALGFAVRVGLVAEKHDHHPDILIGWGKARVLWTTHDAGGITQLDLDLAAATDALVAR